MLWGGEPFIHRVRWKQQQCSVGTAKQNVTAHTSQNPKDQPEATSAEREQEVAAVVYMAMVVVVMVATAASHCGIRDHDGRGWGRRGSVHAGQRGLLRQELLVHHHLLLLLLPEMGVRGRR